MSLARELEERFGPERLGAEEMARAVAWTLWRDRDQGLALAGLQELRLTVAGLIERLSSEGA